MFTVGTANVGRAGGVGLALATAIAVSVPATQGVGVKSAKAVSVPASQGVGVDLTSSAARAVSVPPTWGVNVAVEAKGSVGAPGTGVHAIRLNKTRSIKDFFTLTISSLLQMDLQIIRFPACLCSKITVNPKLKDSATDYTDSRGFLIVDPC